MGQRGRLAKLSDDTLAKYALEYHVDAFRRSKRSGITQVHHVEFGWMPTRDYYRLQKVHDVLPLLEKVVEGGYRVKAALWSTNVSIAGYSFPLGGVIPLYAITKMAPGFAEDASDEAKKQALIWFAMLILPFGDIPILAALWDEVTPFFPGVGEAVTPDQKAAQLALAFYPLTGVPGLVLSWIFGHAAKS